MHRLTRAIIFAAEAHDGQEYGVFTGKRVPYIQHPLRVMLGCHERYQVVAVLHDVLEDCKVDIPQDLVTTEEYQALELLTRSPGQSYEDYIRAIKEAPGEPGIIARAVKKADLLENLQHTPPPRLVERYNTAYYSLNR